MLLLWVVGCAGEEGSLESSLGGSVDPEYGKPLLGVDEQASKDDSLNGGSGPPVSADLENTAVWNVTNQWSDRTTLAANEAGMAWPESSGLTWEEKYNAWAQSMERIQGEGSYETFGLTTPYGKTFPAPFLECAEVTIFMRAAFASWYDLPFYMSAWTPDGTAYFGHFGVRTKTGKYSGMPNFRTKYQDYSHMSNSQALDNWPSDPSLRKRFLTTLKDDKQPFLGEDLYAGAYFDEIFLNKRTGHFMMFLLTYLGSIHLASSNNTYNLEAAEIRAGDILLLRWQKQGIGHTYLVKSVRELTTGQIEAELASGSMPRRQPRWQSAASSKYSFTKSHAGGPGISNDNYAFAALGGGVKRWRSAVVVDGRYYNVVAPEDQGKYISSKDHLKIAKRIEEFEQILGDLPPEEVTHVLVGLIEGFREHLQQYPASCSARNKREEAFMELYDHLAIHGDPDSEGGPAGGASATGWSREEVDRKYRVFADYVFAPLVYDESRTCCWNSTTSAMYDVVMAYAEAHTYDQVTGSCNPPPVFKMTNGDYEPFASFAAGMGVNWVEWSADETCPQSYVQNDTEEVPAWTDFCAIHEDVVDFQPEIVTPEPEEEEEELGSTSNGCSVSEAPGCGGCACEACVCAADDYCCGTAWDSLCVTACKNDCNGNCQ
jgi:hypothetical protein